MELGWGAEGRIWHTGLESAGHTDAPELMEDHLHRHLHDDEIRLLWLGETAAESRWRGSELVQARDQTLKLRQGETGLQRSWVGVQKVGSGSDPHIKGAVVGCAHVCLCVSERSPTATGRDESAAGSRWREGGIWFSPGSKHERCGPWLCARLSFVCARETKC